MLPDNIEAQIIAKTIGIRVERLQLRVEQLQQENAMAQKPKVKLPFLQSLPAEMGKLTSAIEDDARKFVQQEIPKVHEKRMVMFAQARQKLHDGVGGAIADVSEQMDEVLGALIGNNGAPNDENPTSGDSSESPEVKDE